MPSTMENDTSVISGDPVRDAIAGRLHVHRAKRAKQYGRDRNEVELPASVTEEAIAFQAEIQGSLRDAS